MSLLRNERGFTFTEIIIAISIMALGFLAMAQMQYLSLRQKQRAEQGTVATNVIQFIADRDMEEVKRAHLLNSIAFVEAQAGRLNAGSSAEPHLQHCMSGNPDRMCDLCPCNPLAEVTPNPLQDTSTTCAVVDPHDFDPEDVNFTTVAATCNAANNESLIVVKQVESDTVDGDRGSSGYYYPYRNLCRKNQEPVYRYRLSKPLHQRHARYAKTRFQRPQGGLEPVYTGLEQRECPARSMRKQI